MRDIESWVDRAGRMARDVIWLSFILMAECSQWVLGVMQFFRRSVLEGAEIFPGRGFKRGIFSNKPVFRITEISFSRCKKY